jgi:hypothetical protein
MNGPYKTPIATYSNRRSTPVAKGAGRGRTPTVPSAAFGLSGDWTRTSTQSSFVDPGGLVAYRFGRTPATSTLNQNHGASEGWSAGSWLASGDQLRRKSTPWGGWEHVSVTGSVLHATARTPARTSCDVTKPSLHDPHTRPHGGDVSLPRRAQGGARPTTI